MAPLKMDHYHMASIVLQHFNKHHLSAGTFKKSDLPKLFPSLRN